ncbi:MAG: hypothetical protein KKE20_04015 [Nanoarchaeota archaeon]|nr:hypothetical protein [Nanoarchaeota archaeon]
MAKSGDEKLWGFLGVFLTVLGFIIVLLAKKNDKYAMYYGKQGLVLFIAWAICAVIMIIPVIGWIVGAVGYLVVLVLWIIGIIYSISGEMKPIPLIGKYAEQINV